MKNIFALIPLFLFCLRDIKVFLFAYGSNYECHDFESEGMIVVSLIYVCASVTVYYTLDPVIGAGEM